MKIAINALTVREGGGLVALEKLLNQFVRLKPEYEYYVIASSVLPHLSFMDHSSVRRCQFVWAERNLSTIGLWHLAILPAWLRQKRIDVLFSQTCYLPPIGLKRAALLVQDASYFCQAPTWHGNLPLIERLKFKFRRLWVHRSVAAADEVTVQTQALADLIGECIPSASERIKVIPHGPGYLDRPCPRQIRRLRPSDTFEMVYVALYRDHKNFITLFHALKLLRSAGIPVRLHLTLDRDKHVIALEHQINELGVADCIVNHGQLDRSALTEIYQNSHLFIFPSMCESFGFPQVEAMAFGLPIIAADTPVNREVCGAAAMFFTPDDAGALARLIQRFYSHPEELAQASRRSAQRAASFDWSKAGGETLGWMTNGNHRNGRR